jgi:DNA helicase HerA-like ATPase
MVGLQWRVKPPLDVPKSGIWLGAGGADADGIWLGTLAEAVTGRTPRVWLSTTKEQVIAVVGKRGSGKSFTLGVIAEGLASGSDGALGRQENPRSVLLFDPLDVYWTTRYAVAESENAEAQKHFQLAEAAGLPTLEYAVDAWVPGTGAARDADPDWFQTLRLPVATMGLEEWELLLGVNVMAEPMGQAFADSLSLARDKGYRRSGEDIAPKSEFDLDELVDAVGSDEMSTTYHSETLRALRQRLSALARTGLFSAKGTTMDDLLEAGRVTVVMLGRLPQSYRAAVVAVLTRMLIDERSRGAFAEKRLVLDPELEGAARTKVQLIAETSVPRTVVVLDEAQSFLAPGPDNPARALFVRLVKEGRNMGLSAVLATQQPSALDQRVLSQVETFIAHQLVTEPDIRAVRENLKSAMPDSIQFGSREMDFAALLRQVPPGVCVVSAADMNTSVRRASVVQVRPRATVHGGIEL